MNKEVVLELKRKRLKKKAPKAETMRAVGLDGKVYRNVVNHTGEIFGRLTVIRFSHRRDEKSYYRCRCECGKMHTVMYSHLLSGGTRSCGCLRKELNSKLYNKHERD